MRSAPIITGETIFTGNLNAARADASAAAVLSAHQMLGQIAMATNPSNTQTLTLTINGTAIVIHFVTAIGAVANNVLIGTTAAITAQNLYNFLTNPSLTNTTQVAASTANQTLLSYLCFGVSATTTTVGSMNKVVYAPLTSLTCSTTVTSGTYTASTVKLYIEPGVIYVNGTEVYFLGGATPAVTAPASNPRIDLLTIDNTGTLAWTTGAENASPVPPAYPINKMPICEIRNVVGQTIINDNENQATGQGFILNDVRPFLDDPLNFASIPDTILPTTDATYDLGSASKQWNNIYAKQNVFVNGAGVAITKYGGTGVDGALSVSSGTTTISAASAQILIKNYTSLSITGTGVVQFTTPASTGTFIFLLVQGAFTGTSSATPFLDASRMGAAGGAGVSSATTGTVFGNAGSGTAAMCMPHYTNGGGSAGDFGTNAGVGGTAPAFTMGSTETSLLFTRYSALQCGGGGASGVISPNSGSGTSSSGAGGNGGGALCMEVGGTFNFTTTNGISVAGGPSQPAVPGSRGGVFIGSAPGGGGSCIITYNVLTANTGTVNVSGGSTANGTMFIISSSGTFFGPAGGSSPVSAGSNGGSGNTNGQNPVGGAANGYSLVAQNTMYA